MRITGRRPARRNARRHVRAGPDVPATAKDHRFQPTGCGLTEAGPKGQYEENHAARPGERGNPGAKPEAIPVLEIDQQQAAVVLAALEDAAALRREAIGNCTECRSTDERICTDHEGSWEAAEEYDTLRWHLDTARRDSQPNHEVRAATANAPTGHLQRAEHGGGDRSGQMAAGLQPGHSRLPDQTEPEDPGPSAAPDLSCGVPPEVYNAIADYAGEVNRPKSGLDGKPSMSPEEEGSLAEQPIEDRRGPGSAKDQITGRNEASGYEADREPGE